MRRFWRLSERVSLRVSIFPPIYGSRILTRAVETHSDLGVSSPAHALNGTTDSPHSSAPTTPDETTRPAHRHTDSVKIAGEDYFLSSEGRYSASEAKSAPITPQAVAGRNIVFSPRIQFHETWPSGEYDRRGEIATCNRLTPLLAQQIREEINNFKMVSQFPTYDRQISNSLCRRWRFTRIQRSTHTSFEAWPMHATEIADFTSLSIDLHHVRRFARRCIHTFSTHDELFFFFLNLALVLQAPALVLCIMGN